MFIIGEEPFYRPPYHDLRHPLIFYYGHPAVLFINKVGDTFTPDPHTRTPQRRHL
jgi:hypothetical protein